MVVGGGIAGLTVGTRLAERGMSVAVLEKQSEPLYRCNTRYAAGGIFHVCFRSVNEDEQTLYDAIMKVTGGYARPDIARVVARGAREGVAWLKSRGVRFESGGADAFRENTLWPPLVREPGLHWEDRGGDVMMRTLTAALEAAGGTLMLGTRAERLRTGPGGCDGVEAMQGSRSLSLHARHVFLCDGGFQASHELMQEFVTRAPEKLAQRGAAVGNGDALRMAREAGAALVGMETIYGHVLCQEALHNDRLWPFPMMDFVCMLGMLVDHRGRRFVDEGRGGVFMANAIAKLDEPLGAVAVFDEPIWSGKHRDYLIPANPNIVDAGARLFSAPDLPALANELGLSADALMASVDEYNTAVRGGTTAALVPSRTVTPHAPLTISEPPFYAVRVCAAITSTMGGIAIDGEARVLDADGKPIRGLYAVGCCSGGLEGGPLAGQVGQLSHSVAMGLHAADCIVAAG